MVPHAPLYRSLDFWMVRTPVLSIDTYNRLTASPEQSAQSLLDLSQNSLIREAIAVASLSLADSLNQLHSEHPSRKKEQVRRSLFHYLIRMSTRPTPFGLFSGVAYAEWDQQAALEIGSHTTHRKRSRPDMEWLLQIVRNLERDSRVVHQLNVQTNSLRYMAGSRIKLPYVTRYGQRDNHDEQSPFSEEISIRATPVVQQALAAAEQPIPFSDLFRQFHQAYPDTPREKISRFLEQLFQQEFLISDLRPPLTSPSPLAWVIERLHQISGVDDTRRALQNVESLLTAYDAMPLGEGESLYREIVGTMKELADIKQPVQVDLGLHTDALRLPRSVGEEAARAAEVLWRLSPPGAGYPHLTTYRTEFLERYGTYREVPLLELLDEDLGLGPPPTYEYPASQRPFTPQKSAHQTTRDALLTEWATEALLQSDVEVELTEERIQLLEGTAPDRRQAPVSLDLAFSVAAVSEEALNSGEYRLIIGPNTGAFGAGKTFGRFADLLPDACQEKLDQIHRLEQDAAPEALFAEIAYLPVHARAANITLTKNRRQYEIALGTTSSKDQMGALPLSDLVVGLHGDTFYLRSRKLGHRVIPVTGHMLNTWNSPNVYRFLCEIAMEGVRPWAPVQWGALSHAPFRPRLRYGRVILEPAAWRLNRWRDEPETGEHFQRRLDEWRQRWRVPRYVWMAEGDRRLLIDLAHGPHVEDVHHAYRKLSVGHAISFTELGMELEETVMRGQEGWLLNECVFPLIKRDREHRLPSIPSVSPADSVPASGQRTYLPGSEWLFLKLYGPRNRQEELIGWHLREFCSRVQGQGIAKQSFYMRYADPDHHVRLRFQIEPSSDAGGELIALVSQWSEQLREEGLLTRLVIDTYDPEIERYGGRGLIAFAERTFASDSQVTAEWLGRLRMGQMSMSLPKLAVISIADLAAGFGLTLDDQLSWFDERAATKRHLDEFRKERRTYLRLLDPDANRQGLLEHPDGEWIMGTLLQRRDAVQAYAAEVRRCESLGEVCQPLESILASVVHLHLNRLLGTDRKREEQVMSLARHALYHLRQMRMNRR